MPGARIADVKLWTTQTQTQTLLLREALTVPASSGADWIRFGERPPRVSDACDAELRARTCEAAHMASLWRRDGLSKSDRWSQP